MTGENGKIDGDRLARGVKEALNGPWGPSGETVDGIVELARKAGKSLQEIGRMVGLFGLDWDDYDDLPPLVNDILFHLAGEAEVCRETGNAEIGAAILNDLSRLAKTDGPGDKAYDDIIRKASLRLAVALGDATVINRLKDHGPMTERDIRRMMPLRLFPVVVDGPGRYVTRAGYAVVIDRLGGGTFCWKGTVSHPRKCPGKFKEEYQIWHPSGRCLPINESPDDIVAKA